jgi:hypothetical protein
MSFITYITFNSSMLEEIETQNWHLKQHGPETIKMTNFRQIHKCKFNSIFQQRHFGLAQAAS